MRSLEDMPLTLPGRRSTESFRRVLIWHPLTGDVVAYNPFARPGDCQGCAVPADLFPRGTSDWSRGQCPGCRGLDKHIAEREPAEAFRSSVALYVAGSL